MLEEVRVESIAQEGIQIVEDRGEEMPPPGDFGEKDDFQSRFLGNLLAKKEDVENTLHRLVESQKAYGNLLTADDLVEDLDHADREISAQTFSKLIERKCKELEKMDQLKKRGVVKEGSSLRS